MERLKGYIKEIKLNERGLREIKVELISEEEPDFRDLIKKQVNIVVLENQ